MTDQAPIVSPSLVARVKGIILRPSPEWDIIDGEPATVKGLFTGYAMILAAIGPLAGLIGGVVFSHSVIGSLIAAIVQYVLSLVGIFLLSIVIDALASSFGGVSNRIQATKVAVYAWTAAWLAGVLNILPVIAVLGLIGLLYSFYLLYLGLPKLMKAPQDKALIYTIVVIVIAIVIWFVIAAITGAVLGAFLLAGAAATGGL